MTLIRDIVARMQSQQSIAERGMTVGLRALNRLASSELIDRLRLRESTERLLHSASKTTVQTAARAGRTFAAAQKLSRPSRQPRTPRSDLFDLQPTDEQQMLRDSVPDFSMQKLRPLMQTFDNTRPLVAGMAIGVARACLERTRDLLAEAGVEIDYDAPPHSQSAAAAEFLAIEADWEAARLLTLQAAWMADNRKPNSLQASMAKAKAGRTGTDIALRCVALAGAIGYGEGELLEKWARDVKILDIFEGRRVGSQVRNFSLLANA